MVCLFSVPDKRICHIPYCRATQCKVLTITGTFFIPGNSAAEPYRSRKIYYLTQARLVAGGGDMIDTMNDRNAEPRRERLLKMGPRVKERVALLSVSLKFTLLFTLPDGPLLQEQREPHCGAKLICDISGCFRREGTRASRLAVGGSPMCPLSFFFCLFF